METKLNYEYVSLATCSKRTFLLRCLSRWRSLSSGVYIYSVVQVPVAGRYQREVSFPKCWTT